jgi:hyperosmotically inducible protein
MKYIVSLGCLGAALCILAGCNKPESDSTTAAAMRDSQTNNLTPTYRDATAAPRVYDTNTTAAASDADNTGKNVRDRSDMTLTPGDQGSAPGDIAITRSVRRALTSSDQLSTTAKNIKIITINGKVTLRGPVNSDQEKQAIESAVKQAGVTAVDDQLEVKSTNQ